MGPTGQADTYAAGSTFTANPGAYLELGNVGAANARIIATVLLPKGVPLISDRSGSSSDASGSTDNSRVQDSAATALRPTTLYQSSISVERPAGAFELVHLLLTTSEASYTWEQLHHLLRVETAFREVGNAVDRVSVALALKTAA